MAKHKIGADRKQPRISYLTRGPNEPPELMSLDESETLLGFQYGAIGGCGADIASTSAANSKFMVNAAPSLAVVELGVPLTSLNKRMPSISSTITQSPASPSPYTEQSTVTSAGMLMFFITCCIKINNIVYIIATGSLTAIPLAGLQIDRGPQEWGEATRSYVKSQRRHAGRATFQGQVYNFLERPNGWKCIIYHVAV